MGNRPRINPLSSFLEFDEAVFPVSPLHLDFTIGMLVEPEHDEFIGIEQDAAIVVLNGKGILGR